MTEATTTPSQRIKSLFWKRENTELSLRAFAFDLGQNGTKEEKQLVLDWLDNKAGGPKKPEVPKPAAKVAAAAPPPAKKGGRGR